MNKQKIFDNFYSLNDEYKMTVKKVANMEEKSDMYTRNHITEQQEAFRADFYASVESMFEKAVKEVDVQISKAKDALNQKNMPADEKLFSLNFYNTVIEELPIFERIQYIRNNLNEVYRECFLTKAEMYKVRDNNIGLISEFVEELQGDTLPEVRELEKLKNDLLNVKNGIIFWNNLPTQLFKGDFDKVINISKEMGKSNSFVGMFKSVQ